MQQAYNEEHLFLAFIWGGTVMDQVAAGRYESLETLHREDKQTVTTQ